jgi:uncharacterized membrane protein
MLGATLTVGLMAGLFAAFSYAVMPGLSRSDDRTFVQAMRGINTAILNPWFAVCFGGALVFLVAAALTHLRAPQRPVLPWIIAALVLYVAVLVVTMAINVPLNDKLEAAAGLDQASGLAAARSSFEGAWVTWNLVRAIASTAAFGCLSWALVLAGRVSAS